MSYKIYNSEIIVEFDQRGSLTGIYDKRINRKYISISGFSGLFRLVSPIGNWQGRHADSKDQEDIVFNRINDQEIEITYSNVRFAPKKVDFDFNFSSSGVSEKNREEMSDAKNIKCKVNFKLEGEDIICGIQVENKSENEISDVFFPIISGFGTESADMDITWPVQTQINKRIITKPYLNLGGDNHKEWFHEKRFIHARYPLELTSAWMDFSDNNGGISLDVRSKNPQIFDLCIEKVISKNSDSRKDNAKGLYMALEYYPEIKNNCIWESPRTIIKVHNEDWHKTAKSHRTWLETVIERPDTPNDFKTSLGWHFYLMKLQDGSEVRNFDDLPAMADASLDAGINNIMLFGLYNNGHDNDYEMSYIPNEEWGGPEYFTSQVEKVKDKGVRVIPFFNGTLMDSRLLEKNPKLLEVCVKGRTGSRYGGQDWSRPCFDFPQTSYKGYTMTRNNMNYEVCITGNEGRKWFRQTVKRLSEDYKTGNIQLDQLAHKSHICYDKTHGHKSPDTAYTEDLKTLLREIRTDLRKFNPDGLVIGEGFSDLTSSYCDGFWNWNQMDNPQVVRYSVPWMLFSSQIDALDYGEANYAFVNGLLFDLKIEGGVGILSDFPKFQAHLKNLSKIKKAMVDSFATGDFEDEDGLNISGSQYVVAKKYMNKDTGKGCVVFANTGENEEKITIEIKDEIHGIEIINFEGKRSLSKDGFDLNLKKNKTTQKNRPLVSLFLNAFEVGGIEFSF